MDATGACAADSQIPLHKKAGFDCEDGELSSRQLIGRGKLGRCQTSTIQCSMFCAFMAVGSLGFFVLGPLVNFGKFAARGHGRPGFASYQWAPGGFGYSQAHGRQPATGLIPAPVGFGHGQAHGGKDVQRRTATVMMGRPRGKRAPSQQSRFPQDKTPYNDALPDGEMRVMIDDGEGKDELVGIMSKAEALAKAAEAGLDLVLIAGKADTPVVKIVSYEKFRYIKEKKQKEQQKAARAGKSVLKELKMSYNIADGDFGVRKKAAVKFLTAGDKVKFSILLRGRQVTFGNEAKKVMQKMFDELQDFGNMDDPPKLNGRTMIMMVSPKSKDEQAAIKAAV